MNPKKVFLVVFVLFIVSVSMLNAQSRGVLVGTVYLIHPMGSPNTVAPGVTVDIYLVPDHVKFGSLGLQTVYLDSAITNANGVYQYNIDPTHWPAADFCSVIVKVESLHALSTAFYTHGV